MQLISKVQYKRSEKGEFHEVAARSLEDTISLVINYPWQTERNLASVELTCPSVTIERQNGTYLKVAPYFSGKFSLYYLASNHKVYLKVAPSIEDACAMVKTFFEEDAELQNFDRYGFTFNPVNHFKTHPFEYTVNQRAILIFFKFPIILSVLAFFFFIVVSLDQPNVFTLRGVFSVLLFLVFFSSPIIYFFFDYLSVDKDLYLKISRGHDEFIFGTVDEKRLYHKNDIAQIDAYGIRNSRSLWNECELFKITFKNGEEIRFTSLLIADTRLIYKFPDHQIVDNRKFFPRAGSV